MDVPAQQLTQRSRVMSDLAAVSKTRNNVTAKSMTRALVCAIFAVNASSGAFLLMNGVMTPAGTVPEESYAAVTPRR